MPRIFSLGLPDFLAYYMFLFYSLDGVSMALNTVFYKILQKILLVGQAVLHNVCYYFKIYRNIVVRY